jgi:hypothetical protein
MNIVKDLRAHHTAYSIQRTAYRSVQYWYIRWDHNRARAIQQHVQFKIDQQFEFCCLKKLKPVKIVGPTV